MKGDATYLQRIDSLKKNLAQAKKHLKQVEKDEQKAHEVLLNDMTYKELYHWGRELKLVAWAEKEVSCCERRIAEAERDKVWCENYDLKKENFALEMENRGLKRLVEVPPADPPEIVHLSNNVIQFPGTRRVQNV